MLVSALNAVLKRNFNVNTMPKRPRSINTAAYNFKKVKSPVLTKKTETECDPNLNLCRVSMHSKPKIEILNSPVKSVNDKKEYRVIRLENGLVACLISDVSNLEALSKNALNIDDNESNESENESSQGESDEEDSSSVDESEIEEENGSDTEFRNNINRSPDTEEKLAAAGLCIAVGSFSDPTSVQGMAHFLEHMVFMGSEKYPQENDFDAFLKKRGGSDNASTDCESTTFYFECLEKHLAKALDKFAQFFISPLMKREAMTREREAIESEFQMALPSDSYRKEQLLASFAQVGSPANKFSWGNLITLRDNVSDNVLYEGVHEFRKRHYSAHRMALAIQARLPLDVLETFVVDCFSHVPSNKLPADDFKTYADNIFNNSSFKRLYYIQPVKDVCQVDLTWALPSLLHMYKSKPHQYVSWLLGHEGKGSLLSYLRGKLWALAIYSGNRETGFEHNSMYALFTVTLVLTPSGLDHIFEVIEAVFSYIALLKEVGPQERIYNEIKTIEDTSFRFKEEKSAVELVENLAEAMHYYPPEDYLTGSDVYYEYNPEAIRMVINKLNPENLNVMILSSSLPEEIVYDKVEPWFSTSYTDKEIPAQWMEKWLKVKSLDCFSLPEENKFLTTNFDLLNLSENVPTYPEKIVDTDLVELWYKPDNKFKLPNAFICYYFLNELKLQSVVNTCMFDLFISILNLQLTEDTYPAYVAELGYSVTTNDYGIIVKMDGYNQKLSLLLELVVRYMKKVHTTTSEDFFKAVKDKQAKSYYNTFLKPSKLAKSVRLSLLVNTFWSPLDKHRAISQVSYDQFIQFSRDILTKLHIQGLIQGNISKEEALKTNTNLISLINCEPLSLSQISKIRVHQIPTGKQCCRLMSFNNNDTNSIITSYYQVKPGTLKDLVTIEIVMLMMEEPLFDVLRTKEQLGYHVYCSVCDTYGILGYVICVNAQVTKNSTQHVDKRIDDFVANMAKIVRKMPDKKIIQVKEDLIKVKQLVDVHLKEEVSRNLAEIIQQDFMFDRIQREIDAINQVKVSDIRKWLDLYSVDDRSSRKLSIQVMGHKIETDAKENTDKSDSSRGSKRKKRVTTEEDNYEMHYVNNTGKEESADYKYVTDINKFKSELYLFPVHKINL